MSCSRPRRLSAPCCDEGVDICAWAQLGALGVRLFTTRRPCARRREGPRASSSSEWHLMKCQVKGFVLLNQCFSPSLWISSTGCVCNWLADLRRMTISSQSRRARVALPRSQGYVGGGQSESPALHSTPTEKSESRVVWRWDTPDPRAHFIHRKKGTTRAVCDPSCAVHG
jgi:hypothetical protein